MPYFLKIILSKAECVGRQLSGVLHIDRKGGKGPHPVNSESTKGAFDQQGRPIW